MTTIRSAPEPLTTLKITLTASSFESMVAFSSSLSGPIDEYLIREDPTPSGTVWSVTAKASYQDRFRQRTFELQQVREKLRLLQNRQDNQLKSRDLHHNGRNIFPPQLQYDISLFILLHDLKSLLCSFTHAVVYSTARGCPKPSEGWPCKSYV